MEQCKKRKRVGIMGGTFSPIHMGHLILAEQSYRQYDLDYVLFMPAGKPPHKQDHEILSNNYRWDMLKLAIEDVSYFEMSDYEFEKNGLSYTWETLRDLREMNPDTDYYFIMGADSVVNIETWKHPERVLSLCHVLAAVREDTDMDALHQRAMYLENRYNASISLLNVPAIDVSSSDLRNRVKRGESIRFMVPEKVRNYIEVHYLYK